MKNTELHIRVSGHTKQQLKAKLDTLRATTGQHNLTQSSLVRAAIETLTADTLAITQSHEHKLLETANQLRRIGTNLNQLAHAYNAGLITTPVNADNTLDTIRALTQSTLQILLDITQHNLSIHGEAQRVITDHLEKTES